MLTANNPNSHSTNQQMINEQNLNFFGDHPEFTVQRMNEQNLYFFIAQILSIEPHHLQ